MTTEKLYLAHAQAAGKVLAAWFDDAKFRAAWAPDPELFVTEHQRAVAEVCAAKGAGLDRDAVVFLLSRSERWKRLGGDAQAIYAATEGPVVLEPWKALDALREVAATRALHKRLAEAKAALEAGTPLGDARGLVSTALSESALGTGAKPRTTQEVMMSGLQASQGQAAGGARTISRALDLATGGLQKRKFWVMGAASNWGKTSFLVALWAAIEAQNFRVLVCSGEDEEELFGQRRIAVETRADAIRMRDRKMRKDENDRATHAVALAPQTPSFLDVTGVPAEKVAADIRSIVLGEAIDFVFIDYAQVFRLAQRSKQDSRRDELWTIGRLFKEAVKSSGAGGVLFSQITEDEKSGKIKTRDAEDLEHLADVVLFGKSTFEAVNNADGNKIGREERKALFVKKVKNGPKRFDVPLQWDSESASFLNDYSAQSGLYEQDEWAV